MTCLECGVTDDIDASGESLCFKCLVEFWLDYLKAMGPEGRANFFYQLDQDCKLGIGLDKMPEQRK